MEGSMSGRRPKRVGRGVLGMTRSGPCARTAHEDALLILAQHAPGRS